MLWMGEMSSMKPRPARVAAEVGLTLSLAAVLHIFSLWQMPQGGSVSLAMLPVFVLALLRGTRIGLFTGALYGVLDLMMEPYVFHWAQVVLDYPLAFGLCGLAGLFAGRLRVLVDTGKTPRAIWTAIVPGVAIGALARYAAHVLSGVVFFASFARELGQAPLFYSLGYNSFVLVSAAAATLIAAVVLPALETFVAGGRRT
jgi:thiamine transporter